MSASIDRLLAPALRELKAYHVQDSSGMVKLDAMENPYPWPEALKAAWLDRLREAELNRYPDGAASDLMRQLRAAMDVPENLALMLGNGSDELIQLLCMAVAGAPARDGGRAVLMAPEPGFAMYRQIAVTTGLEYVGVPLDSADFSLDMPAMLEAIETHRPELVFLAYPNNPTGNLFAPADIERVLDAAPGLVIVDEAYQPFAETTALPVVQDRANALLMRTMSKLGLAGIRLGVLVGAPAWLDEFDKLRLPYNINTLTQLTARFACEHFGVFEEQAARIRAERERLYERLRALPGLYVYPSRANFILFRTKQVPADRVFQQLVSGNILIKNLSRAHSQLYDCLRVTVGAAEENDRFVEALKQTLS